MRELERKLDPNSFNRHANNLTIFKKVLKQKRSDSNKIYSLHSLSRFIGKPHTKCYTKGKEHKKFEFGSKASFLITQNTGVIVGALNFTESLHDSKTLPKVLEQYERLTEKQPENIFLDRGYRGPKKINNTNLHIPKPDPNITKNKRNRHKRRAAIEPIIGHLKFDYRMARNFLKGIQGDAINRMMAAAAWNFKKVMNAFKKYFHFFSELFLQLFEINVYFCYKLNLKSSF